MQYFFILGRNPELSLAELHAVLPEKYTMHTFFREVAIVECENLDAETLMRRLGGTIKMGTIAIPPLKVRGGGGSYDDILQLLTASQSKDKKLFLGLSAYALDPRTRLPSVRELRALGIEVKRALQEQEYKVRLVTSKEITLSSVIVKREKLLTQGAEIVLLYTQNKIFLGKTFAVQEFQEASARDFGRPERSMGVGMLPIQLTKILLNLARAHKDAVILDPFCGLGTVLTEALQMGYKNLIGTDREQGMINATRKNLEWMSKAPPLRLRGGREELRLPASGGSVHNSPQPSLNLREGVRLIATPVEELSNHLPSHSVDAIVTEPYMGPTREMKNEKLKIQNELERLYINAFREFAKILKPGGHVVFIFPAFKHGSQLAKASDRVLPEIKKLGFTPTELLPNNLRTNVPAYPCTSILYSRPDQKVLREIFVLELKK